jgi:hypothetical protein
MADNPITSGTILSWNLTNWVTVVLMAAVGFGIIAVAQSWYKNRAS